MAIMSNSRRILNKITIVGLGVSGRAAVKLAADNGYAVTGIDEGSSDSLNDFANELNARKEVSILTDFKGDKFPPTDLIVISPGISANSFLGKLAKNTGKEMISELDFASRFISIPMLAITGTNGKTTVTEMTTAILRKSGKNVISAGNIGFPLSSAASDKTLEVIVVEVSSFQLEKATNFVPKSAAILNIASDHMDRYADFTDYSDTKFNIFENIKSPENMVINTTLMETWKERFSTKYPDREPITFSAVDTSADIIFENEIIRLKNGLIDPINLAGTEINSLHNIENLMSAIALASTILGKEELKEAVNLMIHEFSVSPHRQEIILRKDGILFVNDSKATNPAALIAALDQFGDDKNICLIAGGLDKKMDFSSIKSRKNKIKTIFLAGESKKILATLWNDDIHCIVCDTFEESVTKAVVNAEPRDVVLLSPGCASMDMFENYKERGEKFRSIICN